MLRLSKRYCGSISVIINTKLGCGRSNVIKYCQETLMKKNYLGNTFLKGFMFYFLYEDFLKSILTAITTNNSLEYIS